MISRSTEYAIRALVCLAAQPPGKAVSAHEISAATDVPLPFLWKVLRHLTRTKLVRSFKGVAGGYELARPATKVSVLEVLKVGHESDLLENCLLGHIRCDKRHYCAVHSAWKGIPGQVERELRRTTLANLAQNAHSNH
jgi:Rrf2 family protein